MTTVPEAMDRSPSPTSAGEWSGTRRSADEDRTGSIIDRQLLGFFTLAYGLAWGIWLLEIPLARRVGLSTVDFISTIESGDFGAVGDAGPPGWMLYLLTRIQDFSFTIAGLVMIVATQGTAGLVTLKNRLTTFRVDIRVYAIALSPLALYTAAVLVAGGADGGVASIDLATVQTLLVSLNAGFLVSLFLRGAMGEEIGLRGFVLPHLQRRTTPVRASLVLGVLWAIWHLPALVGSEPVTAIFVVVLIVGLSFIFTWIFNQGGGSLVPVLLFHATQNWEEGFETIDHSRNPRT